ncbi:MAG: citrate lyase subunit alpha [Enterobacteriaceae bacterium]
MAVSCCDEYGNASGSDGKSRCGSLGYAMVDAKYARKVVLLTESIEPFPYMPASIIQDQVDYIVKIDSVGDPAKISVGAARVTSNPRADDRAVCCGRHEHSGYFRVLFSANGIGRGVHRLYAG